MRRSPLIAEADERVCLLFPPEHRDEVRTILVEDAETTCRFAANSIFSDGNLDELRSAISLAKTAVLIVLLSYPAGLRAQSPDEHIVSSQTLQHNLETANAVRPGTTRFTDRQYSDK